MFTSDGTGGAFAGPIVSSSGTSVDIGKKADASWVAGARAAHGRAAAEANFRSDEHLAKGSAEAEGGNVEYKWSQTDEEVEVSVAGAPSKATAPKSFAVSPAEMVTAASARQPSDDENVNVSCQGHRGAMAQE